MVSVAPQRKSSVIVRHTSVPGPLPPAQFPLAPPLSPSYAEHRQEHWIKQLQHLRKTIQ